MKKKEQQMLSEYEIDNIWMSYRYCIPRHTIASHCHAGDIANNAYGRMSKERMQFMSKDINQEIYDHLHVHDWFEVDNIWNLQDFRPLDTFYQCLKKVGVKHIEDIKKIRNIECWYTQDGELQTNIYYYVDKDKFNYKSYWDIEDLAVWQQLANLFDINNHKWCELSDGSIIEYYECWKSFTTEGNGIEYKKYKIPVLERNLFTPFRFIDEQFIINDNIKRNESSN